MLYGDIQEIIEREIALKKGTPHTTAKIRLLPHFVAIPAISKLL